MPSLFKWQSAKKRRKGKRFKGKRADDRNHAHTIKKSDQGCEWAARPWSDRKAKR